MVKEAYDIDASCESPAYMSTHASFRRRYNHRVLQWQFGHRFGNAQCGEEEIDMRRRPQMETLIALLAICDGGPLLNRWIPSQRPVARSFDVFFFDLRPNKRLDKQLGRMQWSLSSEYLRIILGMGSGNEGRRYCVTPSLIGRAYTQNDPCVLSAVNFQAPCLSYQSPTDSGY